MHTAFEQLVGMPWEQANCAEVSRMALDLLGKPVQLSALPSDPEAGSEALEALARGESVWGEVGKDWRACNAPGRLVLSVGEDGGPHVGVVIAPGYVISSCRLQGAYITPATRITNVLGVYELQ